MPIIDPATGAQIARGGGGLEADVDAAVRSARAAFDDGRWRNSGAAGEGATAAPARGAVRRARRRVRRPRRARRRPAARVHDVHRRRGRERDRLLRRLADEDPGHDPGRPAGRRRVRRARAARRGRDHRRPGTARPSSSTSSSPRSPRQLGRAEAGRADADVGRPDGRAGRSRPASRPAWSTSSTAPARSSAPASSTHPDVDAICFTGSVETGRRDPGGGRRARQAGGAGARRQERAHRLRRRRPRAGRRPTADGAVWGASGQVCTAGTRVLVQRGIYDDFMVGSHRRAVDRPPDRVAVRPRRPARARSCPPSSSSAIARYVAIGERRGRRARPRRQAPRRHRLLLRADDLRRRAQRDAHRPRGDLRPGDVRSSRSTPRRTPTPSPTTPSTGWPPACGRTTSPAPTAPRVRSTPAPSGSTPTRGEPGGAVRRHEAVRPRPMLGAALARRAHPDQEPCG